jgi:hypothetical protein
MKYILLSLPVLLIFNIAFSQHQQFPFHADSLMNSFHRLDRDYNCEKKDGDSTGAKAIQSSSFDSLFKVITSRVIVNNEDLTKNGKGAALSFTEMTKKLSLNYSWLKKSGDMFNIGFSAESASDNFFELYGKKDWSQGMGFSFSLTKEVGKGNRSIFFYPSVCIELDSLRKEEYSHIIAKYVSLLQGDTTALKNSIVLRRLVIDSLERGVLSDPGNLKFAISKTDYDKMVKELELLRKFKLAGTSQRFYDSLARVEVMEFEKGHGAKLGFSLSWINIGGGFDFKTFNIYDTAVVALASVKKKDAYRGTFSLNYNHMEEWANKSLFYWSGGLKLGNTDYLEELLPDEVSTLKSTVAGSDIKETYNALVLKDYAALKKNYGFIGFSAIGNFFFGPSRFIGFELKSDTKFKVFTPEGINARHTFSLSGGLLFSFEGKDKLAKTTFGFIASGNNIPFKDPTIKDRFSFGIRIGVPFNF